ncbi:MAG: hypothetical protein B7Y80_01220 [Hyphomicrobium sp. 32-62-53]|nr:MAG: hypothetical protein B7Z29_01565 [Hyphomicrobium sp. 12-62-95]OYY01377.1 MAG: hypothetical protein B7Y80_01220 [Hyphomicrobium sp. 32-62-53]
MAGITRTTRLGLFALGFLAATGVEAVRADEAYLCEGGRIVKVTPGTLESLKRTDACIAGYFGLKIEAAGDLNNGDRASGNRDNTALETGAIAVPAAIPAPPKRPATAAKAAERAPAKMASVKEPAAAPRASAGTDYRNVVLLNAPPGAAAVFRHDR